MAAELKPSDRTWSEGDKVKFVTGSEMKIFAGLYFYSGFGQGHAYLPEGKIYWCANDQAYALCKAAGVEYKFHDSFSGYRPVAVGDR